MGVCTGTAKCVLTILSIFLSLVGIGVITIGAWTYSEYGYFDSKIESHLVVMPAVILIGAGVFIFLLGIIGCVGGCKEQKCLLVLFFSFMLVIFVGMVSGSILAYVYHGQIEDQLEKSLKDCLHNYGNPNDTACTKDIDYLQENLHCCGSDNYTDWLNQPWYNHTKPYPETCCKDKSCNYTMPAANDTGLYKEGCHAELERDFKQNLGIIAVVGFSLAVIQVIGMIFSCVLLCKKRSDVPYIGLGDNSGMRV